MQWEPSCSGRGAEVGGMMAGHDGCRLVCRGGCLSATMARCIMCNRRPRTTVPHARRGSPLVALYTRKQRWPTGSAAAFVHTSLHTSSFVFFLHTTPVVCSGCASAARANVRSVALEGDLGNGSRATTDHHTISSRRSRGEMDCGAVVLAPRRSPSLYRGDPQGSIAFTDGRPPGMEGQSRTT